MILSLMQLEHFLLSQLPQLQCLFEDICSMSWNVALLLDLLSSCLAANSNIRLQIFKFGSLQFRFEYSHVRHELFIAHFTGCHV